MEPALPLLLWFCLLPVGLQPRTCAAAPRAPWTSNRVIGSPHPPAPYATQRVFPELTFRNPVDLAFMPGSQRLFIVEQGGRISSFDTRSNVVRADLAIDLRRLHRPFDSAYSLAFHPGFATNRYVFINYVEPGSRKDGSFVSRFTVSTDDPPTLDPESEKVIFRWLSGGHNGCTIAFGNDGFLYISTGDAASPDPPDMPYKTGQDISDVLSSVLRIDVDRAEGTNQYAIPRDNPFVNTPGARPEVWAFGFRNPWRMSFDRATGDLWVGDVGWEQWEMVYRVQRGGNYGWSITEGLNLHVRADVTQGPGAILPPLVAVPHSEGASITGGYVYRGRKLPELRGAYLYGDWETGKFWALRHDGDKLVSNLELCDTQLKPVSFTPDPENELIILDYNGGLYRFILNTAAPANQSFPRNLSETGLFTALNPLTPAPGTVPYRIAAPMWNDHATAEWLLGVPGDGAIVTAGGVGNIAGATWFFPSNTVLARTLGLEMEAGKPDTRRRIETQLLHWDGQAWSPYTFRWNSAQTDATLVSSEGTNDLFTVIDPEAPGGQRPTPWRFMGRAECLRCHNVWAGEALTLNWLQLGARSSGAARDEAAHSSKEQRAGTATSDATELDRLQQLGALRVKNPPRPAPKPIADPRDAALPLADRARTWLHVNCATCHRFGAGGGIEAQFNYEQPIEQSRAYDAKPVRGDFGIPVARVMAPGDPYRSTLFYRVSTEGSGRMPHIGSRLVDQAGVRLLRDWIRSLTAKREGDPDLNAARRLAEENEKLLVRCQKTNHADAVMQLLGSTSGSLALLSEATAPALLSEAAVAAATHTNAFSRELFQRLLPPAQRRKTLGLEFDPQVVLSRAGDSQRGHELFVGVAQCSRCHVCGGEGRAFGPELTAVGGKYGREQLLDQILRPSKVIAPEFKTTTVILRDETEASGFVVRRTGTELVLRDETLTERHLKRSDVKESHESILSAMPEGLLAPLTAQETADLLAYLLDAKPAARSTP